MCTSWSDRAAPLVMSQCQMASINAYRQLRRCGEDDRAAFRAAVRLYRFHHPEVPVEQAIHTVAEWIDEAVGA